MGHAYHWNFAEYSSSPDPNQGFSQTCNDKLAWYEGFAHFFSCLIRSATDDIRDQGEDWEMINVATWGTSTFDAEEPCDNNGYQPTGNACEGAVCATLWDIYDNVETGNPNWNDDEICFGYDEIWNIMVSYQIEGRYCYTFNDFLIGWDDIYGSFNVDFMDNYAAHSIIYTPSNPVDPASQIMSSTQIINNSPNPYYNHTKISYNLKNSSSDAKIEIYNIKGQKVKIMHLNNEQGKASVTWYGTNKLEQNVSPGIYLYRMIDAGKCVDTKKMLLLR
ncbi:MAG: T9SS type A sorting domain-containing protein [Candidatus Cloacimonadota bacterium]|nr:T9SS type A sorting domain-containing protein [Candidatus Cloacimonadota bacterium]